jgi:tRNA-modifying protein YgfZ
MLLLDQHRALREAAGLTDRSSRGRLLLTGADRRDYLQGLLTNDIAALTPGTGCYAAYLTAQGRMIADLRVFETGDRLLVDLDGSLTASVRDRWESFIFSEDVQIADITASTSELGLYGPRAGAVVASAGSSLPPADSLESMPLFGNVRVDLAGDSCFVVRSDDAGVMGLDVIVPSSRRDEFARIFRQAGAVDVDPDAVEATRIEAGRPRFTVDMDETTIPLEAGIEDRAISLTKGCYVGQEIIIRVLHRGQGRVARKLVGLSFESGDPVPARGDHVRAGEREIGTITSAVRSPVLGRPIALGYVHRDFAPPGTAVDVLHDGRALHASVMQTPFVR